MNLRVDRSIRNAFSLLALRYGLPVRALVELAPLALFLVAEGSLCHRRQRLKELEQAMSSLGEFQKRFPDWPPGAAGPDRALYGQVWAEKASIEARDLFGTKAAEGDWFNVFDMPEGWDWQTHNVFACYVREQLGKLDPEAELHSVDDTRMSPTYRLCRNDVRALVGDDEEAIDALNEGWVLLHEMPNELLREGPPEQRAIWVRDKLTAWREENHRRFALDLDLDLDLGLVEEKA